MKSQLADVNNYCHDFLRSINIDFDFSWHLGVVSIPPYELLETPGLIAEAENIYFGLSDKLKKIPFEEIDEDEKLSSMIHFTFCVLVILRALSKKKVTGKQHIISSFFAKSFEKQGMTRLLFLNSRRDSLASEDYAIVYKNKVYSDFVEKLWGIAETEYSYLMKDGLYNKFSQEDNKINFSYFDKLIITFFFGTLLLRGRVQAIMNENRHVRAFNNKPVEDFELPVISNQITELFTLLLSRKWLFVKIDEPAFPIALNPGVNSPMFKDVLIINEDARNTTLFFSLSPEIALITLPYRKGYIPQPMRSELNEIGYKILKEGESYLLNLSVKEDKSILIWLLNSFIDINSTLDEGLDYLIVHPDLDYKNIYNGSSISFENFSSTKALHVNKKDGELGGGVPSPEPISQEVLLAVYQKLKTNDY
jgi:hypothetical protein